MGAFFGDNGLDVGEQTTEGRLPTKKKKKENRVLEENGLQVSPCSEVLSRLVVDTLRGGGTGTFGRRRGVSVFGNGENIG